MATLVVKKTQLLRDHGRTGEALKALYNCAAEESVPEQILSLMRVLETKYQQKGPSDDAEQ